MKALLCGSWGLIVIACLSLGYPLYECTKGMTRGILSPERLQELEKQLSHGGGLGFPTGFKSRNGRF